MEGPLETPAKTNDPTLLYDQIKECLSFCDSKGLANYVLEQDLSEQTIFFDLTSDIVHCLTQENLEQNPSFFETCEHCLAHLIKKGKPRVLLLAILENWGELVDDAQFKSVLGPICDCLLKFPKPCVSSLENSLQAIYRYICSVELPDNNALEGEEEQKLFENDPVVKRLTDIVLATLDFMKPFVEAVSLKNRNNQHAYQPLQADLLNWYLLALLNRPLLFLHLASPANDKSAKSECHLCAERLFSLLACLHQDFLQIAEDALFYNSTLKFNKKRLKNADEEEEEEDGDRTEHNMNTEELEKGLTEDKNTKEEDEEETKAPISELSLSCLLYLVFSENLNIDSIRCVYSSRYIFECNIPFILKLLDSPQSLILYKGLHLANSCLQKIEPYTLRAGFFENDCYLQLLTSLTKIMLHCSLQTFRKLAVNIFTDVIRMFEPAGRYQAYKSLLACCENPGVLGYCIQLVKDEVDVCLQKCPVEDRTFLGENLLKLLRAIIQLPDAETTDILQHSDRILSSMNFVRYLILRDPRSKNISGFWSLENKLRTQFLSPLQVALDMSRAHYKLELKNVHHGEDVKKNALKENKPEMTVNVGNQVLPNLPPDQLVQVFNNALNTFDMMGCVLGRINELLDQHPQASTGKSNS